MSLKQKIFDVIQPDCNNNKVSYYFDLLIITLVLLNVFVIILSTFKSVDNFISLNHLQNAFNYLEIFSAVVFTIEYSLRFWSADLLYPSLSKSRARMKYIFSFMAIVDFLAILPFFLPIITTNLLILRTLRIFRLIRLFKLNRYTSALSSIGNVFKSKSHLLISSMLVVGILMIISSVLMYNIENEAQPDVFTNAFSGLWWSVATLTTVGYGDIYPVTALGKILSTFIALLGIGLVAVPAGIISAGFIEHIDSKEEEKVSKPKHFCPYCGENIKD